MADTLSTFSNTPSLFVLGCAFKRVQNLIEAHLTSGSSPAGQAERKGRRSRLVPQLGRSTSPSTCSRLQGPSRDLMTPRTSAKAPTRPPTKTPTKMKIRAVPATSKPSVEPMAELKMFFPNEDMRPKVGQALRLELPSTPTNANPMRTVFLGFGTNLDDRNMWLDRGLDMLERALAERRAAQSMTFSPRYETEAWGMAPGTPSFLNMVVAVETDMPLPALMRLGLEIEQECGRVRDQQCTSTEPWTLTSCAHRTMKCGPPGEGLNLHVPHPRMMARRFVLQPLVDVAPHLKVGGQDVAKALAMSQQSPLLSFNQPKPPIPFESCTRVWR